MKPRAPFGFWVAGAFSAWFCVAMVVAVCSLDPSDGGWGTAEVRGAAGLLAALAAVETEALWRARPWVWRASLALALGYTVALLVGLGSGSPSRLSEAVAVLMASSVVIVPLLSYIYQRAEQLWPPAPRASAPVAAPRAHGRP